MIVAELVDQGRVEAIVHTTEPQAVVETAMEKMVETVRLMLTEVAD